MKALSVKQPWASLLATGTKTVECRTWKVSYRGPLLICSSKGDLEFEDGDDLLVLPGGRTLGVVELVDVRPMTQDDLAAAYLPEEWHAEALKGFAWHVSPLYGVTTQPIKGKLNLFNVDEASIEKIPEEFIDHWEYLRFLQKLPYQTR